MVTPWVTSSNISDANTFPQNFPENRSLSRHLVLATGQWEARRAATRHLRQR